MKVQLWRPVQSHARIVSLPPSPVCEVPDMMGWPCHNPSYWGVLWLVNNSGLPDTAEEFRAFPCFGHLPKQMEKVSAQSTGAVTVTRLREAAV